MPVNGSTTIMSLARTEPAVHLHVDANEAPPGELEELRGSDASDAPADQVDADAAFPTRVGPGAGNAVDRDRDRSDLGCRDGASAHGRAGAPWLRLGRICRRLTREDNEHASCSHPRKDPAP
jgi:hypothetical protein